jgi:hypothetical protein
MLMPAQQNHPALKSAHTCQTMHKLHGFDDIIEGESREWPKWEQWIVAVAEKPLVFNIIQVCLCCLVLEAGRRVYSWLGMLVGGIVISCLCGRR